MGETKARWRAGQLAFYDGATHETILPLAPIVIFDDFLGGAVNTDLWTEIETNNATKAIGGSILAYHLTNAGETQDGGIYGKDDTPFNLDKGPVFEARVAIHVAPTSAAEVMIGVQNDAYATASNKFMVADEVAKYAAFGFYTTVGAGLVPVIRTDDSSLDSGIINSGFGAVVLDAYHIYRIDFTDVTNVLFYIDGEQVAKTTTFNMSTGSNLLVQPVVMVDKKTADTGLGDIYIDYIKMWQATR
jgi:hypothetical protein